MLRSITPCDYSGFCPYNADIMGGCEYWCRCNEEPENYDEEEEE